MKLEKFKAGLLILAVGAITISCEPENVEGNSNEALDIQLSIEGSSDLESMNLENGLAPLKDRSDLPFIDENLRNFFLVKNAVEPSECGPNEFVAVQNKYAGQLVSDPYWNFDNYTLYNDIQLYYSYFNTDSNQYFGENGESTEKVNIRIKDLERFFNMPGQIIVHGEHTATLNDRDKLVLGLRYMGYPLVSANRLADAILAYNLNSPNFPENPFFALNGFATTYNQLIVIGDGIVQLLAETGIDEEIVWTGILTHEWAHQIQFINMQNWYPNGAADNLPEATRYTELEADFFAAYYMTHKRGATYNWKRVEQFFTLFFQIGDCGFASDGHHGTPAQRMDAARLGYELANDAQKQGKILSADELHEIFVEKIQTVIPAPSTTK